MTPARLLYLAAGVVFILAAVAVWSSLAINPIGLLAVGLAALAFAPLV